MLVGVVVFGDDGGDPAFQPDHLLIAGRQRADRDQDATQVLNLLAGGLVIEILVGQLLPASRLVSRLRRIAGAALRSSQADTVLGRSAAARA